jgi:hypothetical protein
MKFKIFNKKLSSYDNDILWIVSQDLDHLCTLHSGTNSKVHFNYIVESKKYLYEEISYTTVRKILFFFKIKLKTIRKIKQDVIYYTENHSDFNSKIEIRHTIIPNDDKTHILFDEIIFHLPFYLAFFWPIIKFLTIQHLDRQYKEDEYFRARLQLLKNKGVLKKKLDFLSEIKKA